MEVKCFDYLFGTSSQVTLDLFKRYSSDSIIEITFTEFESDIFKNGIFKDEFCGKVLTSFASFKKRIDHPNVKNDLQIPGERTIDICKFKFQNGFVKNSISTPIYDDFYMDLSNILYIRELSISVSINNWEVSKIVKIWNERKDHKRITWTYSSKDVLEPNIFDVVYYKFKYNGTHEQIVDSFISTMNLIFPKKFRIFDKVFFEINQIVNVDELEPEVEIFKGITYDLSSYKKFKLKNHLSTIVEFKKKVYELGEEFKEIGTTKTNDLKIMKCADGKIILQLFGEESSIKKVKQTDSQSGFVLKNLNKNELIIVPENKTINFMCMNGFLYLKGNKNEIICRDSITNPLSIRHFGYSLLDSTVTTDIFILFYLPFNHKPIIKNCNYNGFIKCKLEGNEYKFIGIADTCDQYLKGLDIAITNFINEFKVPKYIPNPIKYQEVYEKYLNNLWSVKILYIIDETCLYDIQVLKRLCDISSIFIMSEDKVSVSQFIKNIAISTNTQIPVLTNFSTKIFNKENIDLSYLQNIENIFNFTNFTIKCVNVVICLKKLTKNKLESFKKSYESILSNDCLILTKFKTLFKDFNRTVIEI